MMADEISLYRRLRDARAAHRAAVKQQQDAARAEHLARAEVFSARADVLAAEVALREAGER